MKSECCAISSLSGRQFNACPSPEKQLWQTVATVAATVLAPVHQYTPFRGLYWGSNWGGLARLPGTGAPSAMTQPLHNLIIALRKADTNALLKTPIASVARKYGQPTERARYYRDHELNTRGVAAPVEEETNAA
jgi:hypothetical protein